ncbi:hypothetical protein Pint_29631 [Pistacia integerrima]|uniref:Uncharacterized protein n=1 Tax=Pistacia integerrima TaxID=434235 RepID=A0ACC0WX57_9ROSI|nr:hypothetical protein Pint_29631 [Pistacia integerrima]
MILIPRNGKKTIDNVSLRDIKTNGYINCIQQELEEEPIWIQNRHPSSKNGANFRNLETCLYQTMWADAQSWLCSNNRQGQASEANQDQLHGMVVDLLVQQSF